MASQTKSVIDYKGIIEAIGLQIQEVWYGLQNLDNSVPNVAEIKKQIANIKDIEISDEQSFTAKERAQLLLQGTLYVVVRFGAGAVNYGSSVTPVSIYCVGVANKVKPVQYLLGAFSSTWTTMALKNYTGSALQVWNTPEVVSNFIETNNEFRNLYRLTGNIVIGTSSVRLGTLTYIYDDENYEQSPETSSEIIQVMSFRDGYRASLDTQPFGNTEGFTKSEVNFSTYTFSISTYLLNSRFTNDLLSIRHFRSGEDGETIFEPNDKMHIVLNFDNGYTNNTVPNDFFGYFKVVDSSISQELAGIPSITVTFTR